MKLKKSSVYTQTCIQISTTNFDICRHRSILVRSVESERDSKQDGERDRSHWRGWFQTVRAHSFHGLIDQYYRPCQKETAEYQLNVSAIHVTRPQRTNIALKQAPKSWHEVSWRIARSSAHLGLTLYDWFWFGPALCELCFAWWRSGMIAGFTSTVQLCMDVLGHTLDKPCIDPKLGWHKPWTFARSWFPSGKAAPVPDSHLLCDAGVCS